MTNEELWQTVLSRVQLNISPANFATWFKQTGIISQENEEIVVSVPNSFSHEWLKNKYHKLIVQTLADLNIFVREIKYVINQTPQTKPAAASPKERRDDSSQFPGQLEFLNLEVDKETNLNPRYLFDNFIVGSFNELAHAAASAVAKSPGTVYNPFFVYGGVGLGKTHLLQAIGNEINKNFSKKNIKYLPAEKLTSEIVNAIKNRQIEPLKMRFQKIDVLIIDDIQFLAGKEKTQEEFFSIFNALYEKNRQIILSSDRPPKAISALTERLRSRFEGGMTADIGFPDLETRLAILKTKTAEKKFDVSEEVLNYLAENIQKNIRELEGALTRLATHQKVHNKPLDTETIKGLLRGLISSPPKIATPKKIIKAVADFYEIKEKDVFDVSRRKEIVRPRQIVMYLLRSELKQSFPAIGRIFKGKDHTTAIHAFNKIAKEVAAGEEFSEEINLIKQRIYNG